MAWQLGSFLHFFASSWQTACQNYFLSVYNDVFVDWVSNRILDEQVAQESLFGTQGTLKSTTSSVFELYEI